LTHQNFPNISDKVSVYETHLLAVLVDNVSGSMVDANGILIFQQLQKYRGGRPI